MSGPRLHPGYTGFRLRLHDRSQLHIVSRSAFKNGKSGNSASDSSCLSASSMLHRERSTSSSKVSTSGGLWFERKLSKATELRANSVALGAAQNRTWADHQKRAWFNQVCAVASVVSLVVPLGNPSGKALLGGANRRRTPRCSRCKRESSRGCGSGR